MEVCEGLEAKVHGLERSISDYVLKNSKLLLTVTEMIINENKNMVYLNQKKVEKHTQTAIQYY